jgi:hypothetical protein
LAHVFREQIADFALFPGWFGNADVSVPRRPDSPGESGAGGEQSPQFLRSCAADGGFGSIDPLCLSSLHGSSSGDERIGHDFRRFPLEAPEHRQQHFFSQATALLQGGEMVGVFPEGAEPMVKLTGPNTVGKFQRGFAHLALRAPVRDLAVLPVAISSFEEQSVRSGVPLKLLSLFDPSEPLFDRSGWHPVIIYQRVNVLIGSPYWITVDRQQQYRGKKAKAVVAELTDHCQGEIAELLQRRCL